MFSIPLVFNASFVERKNRKNKLKRKYIGDLKKYESASKVCKSNFFITRRATTVQLYNIIFVFLGKLNPF